MLYLLYQFSPSTMWVSGIEFRLGCKHLNLLSYLPGP